MALRSGDSGEVELDALPLVRPTGYHTGHAVCSCKLRGINLRVSWSRSIDKRLVHKEAVGDVFLTDMRCKNPDTFYAGAQWPARHHYFLSSSNTLDPMIFAETLRQVTIAIAHEYFDVPMNYRFIMRRLTLAFEKSATHSQSIIDARCRNLTLEVRVRDIVRAKGVLKSSITEVYFWCGSELLGTGTGDLLVLRPDVYVRMRSPSKQLAKDPIIRQDAALSSSGVDVRSLHGRAAQTHSLRFDLSHPVFFDHPVDHLPGMLIIEACRKTLESIDFVDNVTGGGDVISLDAIFHNFLELQTDTTISCMTRHASTVEEQVTLKTHQQDLVGAYVCWTRTKTLVLGNVP